MISELRNVESVVYSFIKQSSADENAMSMYDKHSDLYKAIEFF